ncbi:MAG: hypothetical protein R3D68_02605 [Hyphomicrobiaceae bacterium]
MWSASAGIAALACVAAPALADTCVRADFEAAVNSAAKTLRGLSRKNTPDFQGRLKTLKEKRGWTHDQFLKEAAPLVQDERTMDFDRRSNAVLEEIQRLGAEGANAEKPDCAALAQLQRHMAALVSIQTGKWDYMFSRVDAELRK